MMKRTLVALAIGVCAPIPTAHADKTEPQCVVKQQEWTGTWLCTTSDGQVVPIPPPEGQPPEGQPTEGLDPGPLAPALPLPVLPLPLPLPWP